MHSYILDRMKFSEALSILEIISPWIKHRKTLEVLEFPLQMLQHIFTFNHYPLLSLDITSLAHQLYLQLTM